MVVVDAVEKWNVVARGNGEANDEEEAGMANTECALEKSNAVARGNETANGEKEEGGTAIVETALEKLTAAQDGGIQEQELGLFEVLDVSG